MEYNLQRKMTSKHEKYNINSNHWSDLTQIQNLSKWDQNRVYKVWNEDDIQWKTTSNRKRPPTEDDLKKWFVEYLSNHLLDLTQIWN